ncbi:MAG: DapH/DapD/GlmU-related protein [Actinomycetota bacterium]
MVSIPSARKAILYFHHARTNLAARWFLRGAEQGPRIRVSGRPRIQTNGTMRIADRVQIYSTLARSELVANSGATLDIGTRTLINFGTSIVSTGKVSIGAHCHIGPHCMIMDNGYHEIDPERRLQTPEPNPVIIEDNVWLGARVIVMPGVTIGRDAVIGAGSVVTTDVPPRTVAAGVPARVVKEL